MATTNNRRLRPGVINRRFRSILLSSSDQVLPIVKRSTFLDLGLGAKEVCVWILGLINSQHFLEVRHPRRRRSSRHASSSSSIIRRWLLRRHSGSLGAVVVVNCGDGVAVVGLHGYGLSLGKCLLLHLLIFLALFTLSLRV